MAKRTIAKVSDLADAVLHGVTIDDKQILIAKAGATFFCDWQCLHPQRVQVIRGKTRRGECAVPLPWIRVQS